VRDQLIEGIKRLRIGHLLALLHFGSMPHHLRLKNIDRSLALWGSLPATECRFAKRKPRRGEAGAFAGTSEGENPIVQAISNSIAQ
jgi:hypothetical protein